MTKLRELLANKYVRLLLVITIVGTTFTIFWYYLTTHPEIWASVTSLDIATVGLLSLAYIATVLANAFVLWVSLRLLKKPVAFTENIALTGYSSVVNFFGPLQSGPGFRAAYLKKKHSVGLKGFFYVTVVFYGFFALINGAVIAIAVVLNKSAGQLWVPLLVGVAVIGFIVLKSPGFRKRFAPVLQAVQLTNSNFWLIGMGALMLSVATAVAYFIELSHVDSGISVLQTIIYTAAANLALFVSLTPGAIGFRESFLLLSQQLHGISGDTVIAASIIDRAFYVVFLLALFVLLLLFGATSKLRNSR